ncbi:phosphodiester glycosidase family protein [Alicyclobacillus acidiphilus]|uniref:phosphodiester glycosidase family protein n=1 Tax=Alicyclobacillus acidiphilus TaxID=182455 RepID=UPI0009F820F9|nr:phosphodiester glycosidase family protein [Alicyclobacillus acidiphilus]
MNRLVLKYFLVTAIYGLAVAAVCFGVLSPHRAEVTKVHYRHVPSPAPVGPQPDRPVFGTISYPVTDRTTSIHLYERHFSTYNAYILTVSNPKKISVVMTKYRPQQGQTVEDFVQEYHAIAGINGGEFYDPDWQGTGGEVQGIVISDGKVLISSKQAENIIGFTESGRLISGRYTLAELKAMHVTQALMFGPTLVKDGVGQISGAGSWGYAPRTAIGQRADGTVIFVVTDGRELTGPNDIGASLGDIQSLMLQFGAVTAANLDGGSSATLYADGKLVNQPTDILGQRNVGTALIVR